MAGSVTDEAKDKADEAKDSGQDATDTVKDAVKNAATSDDDNKFFAPLKKAVVAAAVAALTPIVKDAVTNAAEGASKKLPEMLENVGGADGLANLAKDKLGDAGGVGGVAKLVTDQIGGGGDGGGLVSSALGAVTGGALGGGDSDGMPDGTGSGRRMPVQQAVDVAAPIDVVYDQFTQFEEYPNFLHRVDNASQEDDAHVTFKTKQWNFGREWKAEILDQRPDERIAWKSENGLSLTGVTTFHELAPRLTRIEVNVDFDPQGFFEKIGRGWRFAKRSIRADLHRFKAYVEMHEEAEEGWRGYISDGEVVEEEEYYADETEGEGQEEQGEPVSDEEEEQGEPASDEEEDELAAEEELDEEELDEGELEDGAAEDEDLEEEPAAEEEVEEAPSRASSRTRSSTSSSRSRRSKSSSDGRRAESPRRARSRSSSRGRSQSARRDGAKASSGGRSRSSSRSRQRRGTSLPYEDRSRQDLVQRAKELGIEGRSQMNKDELVDALRSKSGSGGSRRSTQRRRWPPH